MDMREKFRAIQHVDQDFADSMFQVSKVGFFRTTPDGWLLCANPTAMELLEKSLPDNNTDAGLDEEASLTRYPRQEIRKILAEKGEVIGFESNWRGKDGKINYVIEDAKALYNDEGDVIHYDCTIENITDRKRSEMMGVFLRKSLQTIHNINKLVAEGVSIDVLLQRVCDYLAEMFYYSVSILFFNERGEKRYFSSGLNDKNIINKMQQKRFKNCLEAAKKTDEVKICTPSSESRRDGYASYSDNDGVIMVCRLAFHDRFIGYLLASASMDIVEDQESRDLFKMFADEISLTFNRMETKKIILGKQKDNHIYLETANEALLMVDNKGIITYVNDKLVELLGYQKSELLGNSSELFVSLREINAHSNRNNAKERQRFIEEKNFLIKRVQSFGLLYPLRCCMMKRVDLPVC